MKKKSLIGILSLLCGIVISAGLNTSFVKYLNQNKFDQIEQNVDNNLDVKNASVTEELTVRDVADYLSTKKAHYPISDEFIEKYQQKSGGYIELALEKGLVVDKHLHEPNQKWHFFDSWLALKVQEHIDDGKEDFYTLSANQRIYTNLICPELLLWIYEACEVSPIKVREAMRVAEQGKVNKTNTSTVASMMRNIVPWDDIEATVRAFMDPSNAPIQGLLKAIDLDKNNTIKLNPTLSSGNTGFTFKSNSNDIATVSDDGVVTGVSYGSTTIVVVSKDNPEITATINVEVYDHGNESNPLSVGETLEKTKKVCKTSGDVTTTIVYTKGKVKSISNTEIVLSDLNDNNLEIKIANYTVLNGVDALAQNDEIILRGLIKASGSNLTFDKIGDKTVEIIKNTRGQSIVSLGKHDNVTVKVNGNAFTSSSLIKNGETFTFSVEVDEGYQIEKVTINKNALVGNDGVYSFEVLGNAEIAVYAYDPSNPAMKYAKYNIKFDMGTRKTSKELKTSEEIFTTFELDGEGDGILESVSDNTKIYGGGYSSSSWIIGDVLKFGTQSVTGGVTLNLNTEINRVKITGYVQSTKCAINIGDASNMKNVSCGSMNVTTKEVVEAKDTSTIIVDFESTRTLRIETSVASPLYITSIEFIVNDGNE